ncbi:hypothetical protein RRG08_066728 [Elysia crispata]|uniref:Uncharacterized protein n=1 Tax=Elysia crispata TaxID=231223 RepID=A0AAE1D9Y6_9GAST|nr:hypothetical protein RRG08_066728 [Elysia crispata]
MFTKLTAGLLCLTNGTLHPAAKRYKRSLTQVLLPLDKVLLPEPQQLAAYAAGRVLLSGASAVKIDWS